MKALLLVAHGSRRQSSNDEICALASRLRSGGLFDLFDLVQHAFLEMAAPNISEGGEKLIAAGADDIIVLPYFLAAGQHVSADLTAATARIVRQHRAVRITHAPHLGAASGMDALIATHLRANLLTNP